MSFANTARQITVGTAVFAALTITGFAAPAAAAPDQTEQITASGTSAAEAEASVTKLYGNAPDVESVRAVYDRSGSSLPQTTTELAVAAAIAGGLLTTAAAAVVAGRREPEAVEA